MASTVKRVVPTPLAHSSTNVGDVKKTLTGNRVVVKESLETRGIRPKYLRYNWWDEDEETIPGVADWSESATPLPCPPVLPLDHPVMGTLRNHPELFEIIISINLPLF
ncbi:hypothetical protein AGABI2DRAFT_123543 [Agaricus bisporus var. bisporus H97]|uniref:hypothetical protein n=1 Tax=Agaricus bisporus var. bisporus (strain H97 / ATCC MYA-4626 / FGSC 10389) TaxID=936046 RepID=UPI00029F71B1|nr:hypothetical protein AGABI2DRAFT_123543 [Agaricus bisporus var. bisporus H97]EKV41610.1 hypothetical protein AGABI2DRAFT_123543 [Agaricus bisporus var. bisporus H97]